VAAGPMEGIESARPGKRSGDPRRFDSRDRTSLESGGAAHEDENDREETLPLPLNLFEAAVEVAPEGERFVLEKAGTSTLVFEPTDLEQKTSQQISEENFDANSAFQAALQAEAPGVEVSDLFCMDHSSNSPALSAARIRAGLERVHQQRESHFFLSRVQRSLENIQARQVSVYLAADGLWEERGAAWGRQVEEQHHLQEKKKLLAEATALVTKAAEANNHRDETQLGKIKEKISKLATLLRYVPEPATQTAAAGAETAASALDWINKGWTRVHLLKAEFDQHQANEAHTQAKENYESALHASVRYETEAPQCEEAALAAQREALVTMATNLHVLPTWGEHEWQTWQQELFPEEVSWAPARIFHPNYRDEIFGLADQARRELLGIQRTIGSWWQERFQEAQTNLHQFKKEQQTIITAFGLAHHQERKILQQKEEALSEAKGFLEAARDREKELKAEVEKFSENFEREQWDQQKLNKERQRFCYSFNQLIRTLQDQERFEQDQQAALAAWQEQGRQTSLASQQHIFGAEGIENIFFF